MSGQDPFPLVEELRPAPDAAAMFQRLTGLPYCLFLDSARRHPQLGRYSFLAADPFDVLQAPADGSDALAELARRIGAFQARHRPDLPPFQGGAAGLLSYDLGRSLEPIPAPRCDEFQVPAMAVGLYDVAVAFDHVQDRAWIISQGFPELDPDRRQRRARQRPDAFRQRLAQPPLARPATIIEPIAANALASQHALADHHGLTSNFSRAEYLEAVRRTIEYIRAGDVFQVNLSQRLLHAAHDDSVTLYLRLRNRNAATFAGYFDLGEFQIVSASPERFLQVRGRQVEARPIKGTRRRSHWPEADLFSGDELLESEKDRAENVMIVDLMRNDLSRVCRADSVRVSQLCRLESYEFVQHLVSAVRGELAPGREPLELLRAAFPGGSITGAPKVGAMQIIAELEPTARGPYCGNLMYLGFDGELDSSILIRTFTAGRGWWQAQVGGGIVVQSHAEHEYQETWHKAEGLIRSLR